MLDLDAYLERIGYSGPRGADPEALFALHEAHATHIPFENLAIQLGELPLRLDLEALQAKLVRRRRGGYCFEQNTLFKAALEAFGFRVRPCEARVRFLTEEVLPRTHMVLVVVLGDTEHLCDVGFGAQGLLQPVPMDGAEHAQGRELYRVVEEGGLRVLRTLYFGEWKDLYAFLPEERFPIDFEMANWYTSTHPESRFVRTLTAQRISREARHILRGTAYAVIREGVLEGREVLVDEIPALLREAFGLEVPEGARFRAFDQNR